MFKSPRVVEVRAQFFDAACLEAPPSVDQRVHSTAGHCAAVIRWHRLCGRHMILSTCFGIPAIEALSLSVSGGSISTQTTNSFFLSSAFFQNWLSGSRCNTGVQASGRTRREATAASVTGAATSDYNITIHASENQARIGAGASGRRSPAEIRAPIAAASRANTRNIPRIGDRRCWSLRALGKPGVGHAAGCANRHARELLKNGKRDCGTQRGKLAADDCTFLFFTDTAANGRLRMSPKFAGLPRVRLSWGATMGHGRRKATNGV